MAKSLLSAAVSARCSPEALAMLQASPEIAERAAKLGLRNRNGRIGEPEVIEARQFGGQAKGGHAGRSGTRKR